MRIDFDEDEEVMESDIGEKTSMETDSEWWSSIERRTAWGKNLE